MEQNQPTRTKHLLFLFFTFSLLDVFTFFFFLPHPYIITGQVFRLLHVVQELHKGIKLIITLQVALASRACKLLQSPFGTPVMRTVDETFGSSRTVSERNVTWHEQLTVNILCQPPFMYVTSNIHHYALTHGV